MRQWHSTPKHVCTVRQLYLVINVINTYQVSWEYSEFSLCNKFYYFCLFSFLLIFVFYFHFLFYLTRCTSERFFNLNVLRNKKRKGTLKCRFHRMLLYASRQNLMSQKKPLSGKVSSQRRQYSLGFKWLGTHLPKPQSPPDKLFW